MRYVALLRGVNVGGASKVEMPKLKKTFERLGYGDVRTYINSGNVLFDSNARDRRRLTRRIETGIESDLGMRVPVVVRSADEIDALVKAIPRRWVNDPRMRCDVMFLWPDVDRPEVLEQIPANPKVEDVRYVAGALIWRVDRANVGKSRVGRIIGTELYRGLSIRNVNTVRKLHELMRGAEP